MSHRNYPMYKDISREILDVIEPSARARGLEIVDAEINLGRGRTHVRIVVDTPGGDGRVSVDACAEVSREIGHGFDAEGVIPGRYTLEVCSPGVDRVLGRAVDFERSVGSEVCVETRQALEGRRRFRGRLVAFAQDVVQVRVDARTFQIPFGLIARAQAFHPFAPGAAKR